jgi:hypothetical protein
MLHTECVGMFIVDLNTKFICLSPEGSLINNKYSILRVAMLLIYAPHKKTALTDISHFQRCN